MRCKLTRVIRNYGMNKNTQIIIAALALVSAGALAAEPAPTNPKPYQVTVNAPWYERAAWREYQAARHARQSEAIGHRPAQAQAEPAATPAPALSYDAITNKHESVTTTKSLFDQKLADRQQQQAVAKN